MRFNYTMVDRNTPFFRFFCFYITIFVIVFKLGYNYNTTIGLSGKSLGNSN